MPLGGVNVYTGIMDNVENLILEHLKRFQSTQDRAERKLEDIIQRLGQVEISVANLHKDFAHSEVNIAGLSVRIDRINDRLDRIEKRLELVH